MRASSYFMLRNYTDKDYDQWIEAARFCRLAYMDVTVLESIAVAQQFLYIQLCDILLFSKVSVSKVVFPSLLMSSSPRCEEVEIRAESRMTLVRSRKFCSPWDDRVHQF